MADLTPNNREEYWLKGMVDGQTTLEPNKRREFWYKEIVDAIGSGGGGGTGGGVLVCTKDTQSGALDKTWNEIASSSFAIIKSAMEGGATFIHNVSIIFSDETGYGVGAFNYYGQDIDYEMYIANSADGYPVKAG